MGRPQKGRPYNAAYAFNMVAVNPGVLGIATGSYGDVPLVRETVG